MSQVKKLTRLGSDTRKIAALLQAKAPKGEMLAYINPKEAALLKAMGGSGKPHADTGIPSYQVESDFSEGYMADMGRSDFEPQGSSLYLEGGPAPDYQMGYPEPTFAQPAVAGGVAPAAPPVQPAGFPEQTFGAGDIGQVARFGTPPIGIEPVRGLTAGIGGLADALGLQKRDLLPLGLAGVQSVLGARQGRAAARQGQAARQEMQAMAAPYRQQGQALQAQAARGELTPQAQQSLQAVRAQLTQGAQARGGVGAAQVAQQVESVRQQLLQSQADYGLKLSGIGDQIALGAIRAGIQADQYVNQLTGNYMNNIMRMIGQVYIPQQPAVAGGQR